MEIGEVITIKIFECGEICAARVRVKQKTQKAVFLEGGVSQAWFPKSAIDEDGFVAGWLTLSLTHQFLWQANCVEAA